MDVSVDLVTLDAKADVERLLPELRAQTGVTLELVVVDNGSKDGTREFLEAQPDVRLIANPENRWLAPAWNQGFRAGTAPYVLFTNPDTGYPPDLVARLKAALEADPVAALAAPRLVDATGRDLANGAYAFPSVRWIVLKCLGLAGLFGKDVRAQPRVTTDETVAVDIVNGAIQLARREAIEAVGGFDDDFQLYLEEVDLHRRLRSAGYRILLVGSVTGMHSCRGTPMPPGSRERAGAHGEQVYIRKHHGRAAALVVRAARAFEQLRLRLAGSR